MSSFAKLALVAAASAALSVGAVQALQAEPMRLARLDAQGFASGPVEPDAGAVAKAADGHFWAEADVAAQTTQSARTPQSAGATQASPALRSPDAKVRFLVDTGATAVALTTQDAARLGLRPQDLKYSHNVTTAGGSARAAAVTLASISIGGARLENVQALVVSDGLDVSLLGMSYLGRLTRFEATRDTLRLEP